MSLASDVSPRASWIAASGRAASTSAVETVEQLLGLLEAALPDPQVGEPDERTAAQTSAARAPTAARPRSARRRPRASARRR